MARPRSFRSLASRGVERSARLFLQVSDGLVDPGVLLTECAEEVHQARTSLRRLRAILRAARPMLRPASSRALIEDLRWLGGVLGTVRDVDVLTGNLRLLASPTAVPAPLLQATEVDRARAVAALCSAMESERYRRVHAEISRLPDWLAFRGGAEGKGGKILGSILRREFRRLSAMISAARDARDAAMLHAIRIQAKRCRYLAELAVPCSGKPARRFVASMTRLQDLLGEHHDLAVLLAWLPVDNADSTPIAAAARDRMEQIVACLPQVWAEATRRKASGWIDS